MINDEIIEIPLKGGRTTIGVVKIGETVHRPVSTNGDFVHHVLCYLENKNFPYAPRFLGIDAQGREILTFMDGTVPDELGSTNDKQLFDFMKIVRALHDTSEKLTSSKHHVICHGDLSPCNVVFRDGDASAIIDWDGVYFGERWEDLAYICWLWINLANHTPRMDAVDVMKIALDCYGVEKTTTHDFSSKLMCRMDKALNDVSKLGDQYERVSKWVMESKRWVIEHQHEIQSKIELI